MFKFSLRACAAAAVFISFGTSAHAVSSDFFHESFGLARKPASVTDDHGVKHVFLVVLENANYDEALAQPYLSALAKRGALLANYHAIARSSQPNDLALIAGDTLGVNDDQQRELSGRHIGDLIEGHAKNWRVYAEDFSGGCEAGGKVEAIRRHIPFLSFLNVSGDRSRCGAHVVAASAFDRDMAQGTLPDFALYVPNAKNDGRETDVAFADAWLKSTFGPRFNDPKFMRDTLVLVTFDQNNDSDGNSVLTLMLGQGVRPGAVSNTNYTHYSLLRTIENILGVGNLSRQDAFAESIEDVWKK